MLERVVNYLNEEYLYINMGSRTDIIMIQKGKTYKIKSGQFKDSEYWVEDLWNQMPGNGNWIDNVDRIGCLEFAARSFKEGGYDPEEHDKIYYGKIGMFGKLIHESQIGEEVVKK